MVICTNCFGLENTCHSLPRDALGTPPPGTRRTHSARRETRRGGPAHGIILGPAWPRDPSLGPIKPARAYRARGGPTERFFPRGASPRTPPRTPWAFGCVSPPYCHGFAKKNTKRDHRRRDGLDLTILVLQGKILKKEAAVK